MSDSHGPDVGTLLSGIAADVRTIAVQLQVIAEGQRASPTSASNPLVSLIDSREMAAIIGCHVRTLRRLELDGSIPKAIYIGGAKRWRRGDIDEWLRKKRK